MGETGKMTWQGPGAPMSPWEGHQQLPSQGRGQPHPGASVWSALECRILFPKASSQPLHRKILPRTLTIGPSSENLPVKGQGWRLWPSPLCRS